MNHEPLYSRFHADASRRPLLLAYSARMTEKCQSIEQGLLAGDVELVGRLGHHYKGSGAAFGYPDITDAGAALEQAAKQAGSIDESVRAAAGELITLCRRVQAGLSAAGT